MPDGTLKIRVQGVPFPLEFGDWVHDALFGTVRASDGDTADLVALSGAEGDTKPGDSATLTARETNLPAPGSTGLPKDWEALIYSIQVAIGIGEALTLTNIRDFYAKTLATFYIGKKDYASRPIYCFSAAGGAWGVTTATDAESWSNGVPSPRDKAAFIIPHHLFPGTPYKVVLSFDEALSLAATTGYDIEVALEGLIKRPVA
jgi:hypothetical protein